jgi:hypothetical protein
MAYSDITQNILNQMKTAGQPKTTTQTATPAGTTPGPQIGAMLGMVIGQLLDGKKPGNLSPDTSLTDSLAGSSNPYGIQGFATPTSEPVTNPIASNAAAQVSPDLMAALMQKTPQELMLIYNYAKKMQAQESGLGLPA